jgi:hypothetical protein
MKIEISVEEILAALGLLLVPSPVSYLLKKGKNKMSEEVVNEGTEIGIKHTQEMADLVVAIVQGFHAARADGKWDVADLPHVLPAFAKLGPALEGFSSLGAELKDLDAEEIKALAASMLPNLGIPDGKIKTYVEEGFAVLAAVYKIIRA